MSFNKIKKAAADTTAYITKQKKIHQKTLITNVLIMK